MNSDYFIDYQGETFEVQVIGYQPELPISPWGLNDGTNADPGQGEEVEFKVHNVDDDTELDLQNDPEFCKLVIKCHTADNFWDH
jgi:hypothetical protein